MKHFLLTVLVACFATPALAQDGSGWPVSQKTIPDIPAYYDTTFMGGWTEQATAMCLNTQTGDFVPPPCTSSLEGVYVGPDNYYIRATHGTEVSTVPSGALAPTSLVGLRVEGWYPDAGAPAGLSWFSGIVPLSAFARAGSVNASIDYQPQINSLGARIDTFMAMQQAQAVQLRANQLTTYRGIAMASSLYLLAPADGRNNRLAMGLGTFGGANAFSLNYTRRAGDFDMSLSAAFSGGDNLGKAGVGISW